MKYHVAELNIAQMKYPMEDERMYGFSSRLEEINNLAEQHSGFVWRLKDDSGDATDIRAFDDPKMLVNLSVWEDLDALKAFVFKTMHVEIMRQRKEWFHLMKTAYVVLWWIPAGTEPTLEEAKAKLEALEQNGPSPEAFTFKQSFSPPGG